MPDHGMGRHRQPEPPERYRSLFAAEWIPASSNPQTVWDARCEISAAAQRRQQSLRPPPPAAARSSADLLCSCSPAAAPCPPHPPLSRPLSRPLRPRRDALEACSGLWGDERSECLSVFGLDAGQVDAFYSTVLTLELALEQDTGEETGRGRLCMQQAVALVHNGQRTVYTTWAGVAATASGVALGGRSRSRARQPQHRVRRAPHTTSAHTFPCCSPALFSSADPEEEASHQGKERC